MAGIYIHIPFCRAACRYCDFFFSVALEKKEEVTYAIIEEARSRKDFLRNETIQSVYFGGGTPSILSAGEVGEILECLAKYYQVAADAEITLEANPDDLNTKYLAGLRSTGINRLSIGIQSWDDSDLQLMHRLHDANRASECLYEAADAGFNNINADLIYGLPGMHSSKWEMQLRKLFNHPIAHLSAYHLTYEQGTPFYHDLKNGKITAIDEDQSILQYEMLLSLSNEYGLYQYEVSNFAKTGFISRHNQGYWTGMRYLGLGPSAHSYDGEGRYWNVSNIRKYILGVQKGQSFFEREQLSKKDSYNEYLLTSLRTIKGIDLEEMEFRFGKEQVSRLHELLSPLLKNGKVVQEEKRLFLSTKGMILSDRIISDLFEV
jgi:oxygen-independent coproporphyrinogen III oxidase